MRATVARDLAATVAGVSACAALATVGQQGAAVLGVGVAAAPWIRGIPTGAITVAATVLPVVLAARGAPIEAVVGAATLGLVAVGAAGRAAVGAAGVALALVLAAAQAPGVLLAPCLLGAALALPVWLAADGAATLDRRARVGSPLLGGALACAIVATALFVATPRVRGRPAPAPVALTGFQARVDLDAPGPLLDDPTPILRVVPLEGSLDTPLRLRGAALVHFDGTTWTADPVRQLATLDGVPDAVVRVEPLGRIDEGAVFTPGHAVSIDIPVMRDGADALWAGAAASLPYVVGVGGRPPFAPDPAWTHLPALDPRIAPLAAAWAGDAEAPLEVATRLARHLVDHATYDRRGGDPGDADPLATFLFDDPRGHCEHVATALAVLLRARGVPARPVNGFHGGDWNPAGWWTVRRSHAHAWVEVGTPDGWVVVDPIPAPPPTPPPRWTWRDAADAWWTRHVVGWDRAAQRVAARRAQALATGHPALLVALAIVGTLVVGWRWLRKGAPGAPGAGPPVGRVARAHRRVRRALARANTAPPPDLPPVHAARWARAQLGDDLADLETLAWQHYAVRYGVARDDDLAREAEDTARRLVRAIQRVS